MTLPDFVYTLDFWLLFYGIIYAVRAAVILFAVILGFISLTGEDKIDTHRLLFSILLVTLCRW